MLGRGIYRLLSSNVVWDKSLESAAEVRISPCNSTAERGSRAAAELNCSNLICLAFRWRMRLGLLWWNAKCLGRTLPRTVFSYLGVHPTGFLNANFPSSAVLTPPCYCYSPYCSQITQYVAVLLHSGHFKHIETYCDVYSIKLNGIYLSE